MQTGQKARPGSTDMVVFLQKGQFIVID